MSKQRLCITEIHSRDPETKLERVDCCRHPMRLSMHNRQQEAGVWTWVCPNDRCGTAHVLTADELRTLTA